MTLKINCKKKEMTFNKKIEDCLKIFRAIDKPDYTNSKINLYTDFVELMIVLANEDGISQGDIQDRFFGTEDFINAKERDEKEAFVDEIIRLIEERSIIYNDDYPFIISYEPALNILIKTNQLNWRNKLYIQMLLSSKLNICTHFQTDLTNDFEQISSMALKSYLPLNGIVKEFGKNSGYTGNAQNKIKKLAIDLDIEPNLRKIRAIAPGNMQERGLDVVGWIPFEDNCQNKLIFLGQCACGKNFDNKHGDTQRFANYFTFYCAPPIHTLFIPYSFVNPNHKDFYHTDLFITPFLYFDRLRILNLNTEEEIINSLESIKIVDAFIEHQEPII